jgi:hypothetical protein
MAAAIKVAILALAPDLKLEDRDHGGKNSFHQSTGLALGPLTYLKRKSERNYDPNISVRGTNQQSTLFLSLSLGSWNLGLGTWFKTKASKTIF